MAKRKQHKPLTLAQRIAMCGLWSAARWAFKHEIPFEQFYVQAFGRLPRI